MTRNEANTLGWACLVFGWGFSLCNAPGIALVFFSVAAGLLIFNLLRNLLDNDDGPGGPLGPA
jgi:hypothetical protein